MKTKSWRHRTLATTLTVLVLVSTTSLARADEDGEHDGRWHSEERHDHYRGPDRSDYRGWRPQREHRDDGGDREHWEHEYREHHERPRNRDWWWPTPAIWVLRSETPITDPGPPPPVQRFAYYCGPAAAYYPTVPTCPGGWQAVPER